jgi:hypothetical protein
MYVILLRRSLQLRTCAPSPTGNTRRTSSSPGCAVTARRKVASVPGAASGRGGRARSSRDEGARGGAGSEGLPLLLVDWGAPGCSPWRAAIRRGEGRSRQQATVVQALWPRLAGRRARRGVRMDYTMSSEKGYGRRWRPTRADMFPNVPPEHHNPHHAFGMRSAFLPLHEARQLFSSRTWHWPRLCVSCAWAPGAAQACHQAPCVQRYIQRRFRCVGHAGVPWVGTWCL